MLDAALSGKEGLHRVQRRGADIAVHHAQRDNRHREGDLVRTGLHAGPPAADSSLGRCFRELFCFLMFFFLLLGDYLALFFGRRLARDLGRVGEGIGLQQRLTHTFISLLLF